MGNDRNTYKGYAVSGLRRIFQDLHNPQAWRRPRTVAENAEAVAAIEYCGLNQR